MNNNIYSGTVLGDTYNPIVFKLPQDQELLLGAEAQNELLSIAGKGLSVIVSPIAVNYSFDDVLKSTSSIVDDIVAFWEFLFKRKELEQLVASYNCFVKQIQIDFEQYKNDHEKYLQNSKSSVAMINRRKTIMKDYLLLELSEQLKRVGLNGDFGELIFEELDLRNWPIDERYNIVKQNNLQLKQLSESYIHFFSAWSYPVFTAVYNRIRIKRLNKAIEELKPISSYNKEQMESDIEQLDVFSKALSNVVCIYTEILEKIKPIMKRLLRDLEDLYAGDVDRMPTEKADALYNIKELLKDLSEKRIVPISEDAPYICSNVCEYSNELSMRYNRIRETIYQNFC